ncbi:MAG: glycosyltransferase, partial [bacterium]
MPPYVVNFVDNQLLIRNSSNRIGSGKIRVAIFNTHPIQYYAPLWRKLSEFSDLEVMVFYGSDFSVRGYRDKEFQADVLWDVPLLEGYHSEYLRDFEKVDGVGFFLPMWWPAVKRLIAERPDVVVITAYHAAFWYGIVAAAVAMGARIVMRHDATDEAYGSKGIKAAVRSIILRSLYRSVAQFAIVGERARRHLKKYGVGESKMSWSPFCIDSDWLESQRTL